MTHSPCKARPMDLFLYHRETGAKGERAEEMLRKWEEERLPEMFKVYFKSPFQVPKPVSPLPAERRRSPLENCYKRPAPKVSYNIPPKKPRESKPAATATVEDDLDLGHDPVPISLDVPPGFEARPNPSWEGVVFEPPIKVVATDLEMSDDSENESSSSSSGSSSSTDSDNGRRFEPLTITIQNETRGENKSSENEEINKNDKHEKQRKNSVNEKTNQMDNHEKEGKNSSTKDKNDKHEKDSKTRGNKESNKIKQGNKNSNDKGKNKDCVSKESNKAEKGNKSDDKGKSKDSENKESNKAEKGNKSDDKGKSKDSENTESNKTEQGNKNSNDKGKSKDCVSKESNKTDNKEKSKNSENKESNKTEKGNKSDGKGKSKDSENTESNKTEQGNKTDNMEKSKNSENKESNKTEKGNKTDGKGKSKDSENKESNKTEKGNKSDGKGKSKDSENKESNKTEKGNKNSNHKGKNKDCENKEPNKSEKSTNKETNKTDVTERNTNAESNRTNNSEESENQESNQMDTLEQTNNNSSNDDTCELQNIHFNLEDNYATFMRSLMFSDQSDTYTSMNTDASSSRVPVSNTVVRKLEEDILKKLQEIQEERIILEVGNQQFHTSRVTMRADPHSLFAMLCRKDCPFRPSTSYGRPTYYFDRDSSHFRFILNYLRNGAMVKEDSLPRERRYLLEMLCEARFFRLQGLENAILARLEHASD